MATIKQITKLFGILPTSLVKRESASYWIRIITTLQEYPIEVLKHELQQIIYQEERQNKEPKVAFYYLEAVRRNLLQRAHQELIKDSRSTKVPESIKSILKDIIK